MTADELALHGTLKSFMWRISNLYWIQDESGKKMKFRPNWAQKAFLAAMWWLNVILKARQLGMSTLMAVFILDTCLFGRDKTCGVIDKTDADAVKKLKKIRFAYDNLDCTDQDPNGSPSTAAIGALIKQTVTLVRDNDHELEFSNSSQVWAGTSLRGGTIQVLHVSELGYIAMNFPKRAEEIRAGSLNTVHKGCIIVIESTHEGGKVGLNYEMIVVAQESPADLGELDWKFHFFAWWQDPKYTIAPRPIIDPVLVKYFADLMVMHGISLTEGQKSWYAAKVRVQKEAMKKEYPSTPDEAVNAVIKGAIYGQEISRARAEGRVLDFALEPGMPIYTAWDIGVSDFADLWFVQPVGLQHRVFDFYENNGYGAAHYVEFIRAWEAKHGVTIAGHLLPHDAGSRQFGSSDGNGKSMSVIQQLDTMGLRNCYLVPRTPDVWIGINKLRSMMPSMVFHQSNCAKDRIKEGRRYPSGMGALEAYRTADDSTSATIKEMPIHDDSSHAADGLRTYAEGDASGMVSKFFAPGHTAAKIKVTRGGPLETHDDFDDDQPRVSYGGTNNRKVRVRK
jgi:hypothetical protein